MPIDNMTEPILNTPFPSDVKIRVSITGLAFCELDTAASRISFLSHIPGHQLTMTVVKRMKDSGSSYPPRHYRIPPGEPISIELDDAVHPKSIKTNGQFPLTDIVNLRSLHGVELELVKPAPTPPTSDLTVRDCAFYTLMIYPGVYKFVEKSLGWEIAAGDIGSVMSGNIVASKPASSGRIVWAADTIDLPGTSDDTDTGEAFVYDIVFNNHCKHGAVCSQLATREEKGGTDFFFYYDVLRQKDRIARRFHLLEQSPRESGTIVDPFDNKSGDKEAACNPVITNPPEPYG